MKDKVENRVKAWKKIFTQGHDGIDENSSWQDILNTLQLSKEETQKLVAKTTVDCGIFEGSERDYLYALPHYVDVMRILQKFFVEDAGNIASVDFQDGYKVYFLRYPKVEEKRKKMLILVEAVVVSTSQIPSEVDFYTFLTQWTRTKNVVIRYDNHIPQEWIDEKKKIEEREKKHTSRGSYTSGFENIPC